MEYEPIEENSNDFQVFLRTILMILENHNFKSTANLFRAECKQFGYKGIIIESPTKSPKVILQNFSTTQPYRIIIENKGEHAIIEENPVDSNMKIVQEETKTLIKSPERLGQLNNCVIIIESPTSVSSNQDCVSSSDVDDIKDFTIESAKLEKEKHNHDENEVRCSPKFESKHIENLNNTKIDYDTLKNKFTLLQTEHQKLMDVVTELTYALQTSIKGEIEDTHVILNNCEKIYPELFCNKPLDGPNSENNNLEKTSLKNIKPPSEFVNNDLKSPEEITYKPLFGLDFQKVKHDLQNAELDIKLALFQALRWRITKTSNISREEVIKMYIRYDLLNVHSCAQNTGYPKNSIVFTSFYCGCKSPQVLQQAVTRLVNALASIKIGRDYIIHQSVIPNILLSVLLGTHPATPLIDDVTRDMIIATLQKISLRYGCRRIMISEDLTGYITKFLIAHYKTLNDYCLEYSCALLRNLWLHKESREKCQPFAPDIVKLLANLLNEQYSFCLPYVIGAFYNLLPDTNFHRAAKEMQLEQIILNRVEKLEGEMKEQLQYILEIYLNPESWQPLCECDLGTDSEHEIDIIEAEIDQNESLIHPDDNGEQFLHKYRMSYSVDGIELNSNYINNLFSVPVTPNVNSRYTELNNQQQFEEIPKSYHEIHCLEYAAEFLDERMNSKISINQTEYKEIQVQENEETLNKEEIAAKTEIEMTFCEDTQQFYYVPSKHGIFEPDKINNINSFTPSFFKTIGDYDLKNISKSLPVSPRNIENEGSTKEIVQYMTTTANYSGICYREGLTTKSFSDTSTPHIGFCNENKNSNNIYLHSKYSCACFADMQRSFDEEINKIGVKNNNEKTSNLSVKNEITTTEPGRQCKYKGFANSAPVKSSSPKRQRDTNTSKSFDESDCTSVFESRPRILRTP